MNKDLLGNAINLQILIQQVFHVAKGEITEDSLVVKTKISANQNMKFLGKNGKKFYLQEGQRNSKTVNKYLIEFFGKNSKDN